MQDRLVTDETRQVVEVEARRGPRQRRSVQQKREMVEATLVPGASIARVARAYGVNANQLFHWRKLYRHGLLEEPNTPRLLPVRVSETVAEALDSDTATTIEPSTHNACARSIRIEIAGKARVIIDAFDDRALRTVLEYVLR